MNVENWGSRFAFLLAAIGSAVGLGNIWRFPYMCYKNGGGAFLIPYFVALFTVGIPLLIAEFTAGSLFKKSAPATMRLIDKKLEWLGWWAVISAFFIAIYYAVIISWCLCYMVHSIGLVWQPDASQFFFDRFLSVTSSPAHLGGINMQIFFGLLFVWTFIYLILYKGVKSIGKITPILLLIPTAMLLILAVVGISLPHASDGLNFYLSPDFSKLSSPSIWLAAYAQIFFSLSLAQGIMIAYASFLPKKADVTNNAFITAFADSGIAFLAGFAVFSVLGYLSYSTHIPMEDAVRGGIGLAFVTYPTGISQLSYGASVFGSLFFFTLFGFGITSAYSMLEAVADGIKDKFNINKQKILFLLCMVGLVAGLVFAGGGGIYWVEITDHFITNFALVLVGLLECIMLAYVFGSEKIRRYANENSDFRLGRWFSIMLKLVAPVVLISIVLASVVELVTKGYENYPAWALATGVLIAGVSLMIALLMARYPCRRER